MPNAASNRLAAAPADLARASRADFTREHGMSPRPAPQEGDLHHRRIAAVLARLQGSESMPSLAQLAREAEYSPFHLQRLFVAYTGLSPKEYWQALALGRASSELLDQPSVLHAALAAGLSGPSRLHDLMIRLTALTPGEFRGAGAGMRIQTALFDSVLGRVALAVTTRGVLAMAFVDDADGATFMAELAQDWPQAALGRDDAALQPLVAEIQARLAGSGPQRPIGLALAGTPFRFQVWQALLAIPEGAVCSYAVLAERMGRPGAARAVGQAVGANPVAVLIPCHRVIRASAGLGGYHWGVARKQRLLAMEFGRCGRVASTPG